MTLVIPRDPLIVTALPLKLHDVKAPITIISPLINRMSCANSVAITRGTPRQSSRLAWGPWVLWIADHPAGPKNDMGTSSSISGKRPRDSEESPPLETPAMEKYGKRPRRDARATSLAPDTSAVQEHAQCWNPAMDPQVDALKSSVVGGVDGAISAWVADECYRTLGQELSLGEEIMHSDLVREGEQLGEI